MDGRKPSFDQDGNGERGRRLAAYARRQAERAVRALPPPGHSMVPADALPGYDLLSEVHRGAQGAVYEGFHHITKRRVAVKFLHENARGRAYATKEDFEREIEILAQLQHPNIVAVHDGGATPGGRWFLVMDYVDGVPVDEYVAEHELSTSEVLRLFVSICEGVNAAHLRGVVHRDLKPSNIRVDDAGQPHVLDFGLAKILDSRGTERHAMTLTGDFVGTVYWASPEQADGAQDRIDVRSDVYALGVLLFQALTGSFPYDVVGPMSKVLASITLAESIRPSRLQPELDDDVDTIVLKCLSKQPERRYQNAGELARDLERYLAHQPIDARRDSTWYVLRRTVRRHRAVSISAGLGLVALFAFLVTTTVLYRRAAVANAAALEQANLAAEIHREWVSHASFVVEDLAGALVKLPESMALRRTLLESTLSAFGKLRQFDERNPQARDGWARTQIVLSKLALAIGRDAEAMEYRRQALVVREQLVNEFPENLDYQRSLALSNVLIGDLLNQPDQVAEKRVRYEQAFAIDQVLVARFPNNVGYIDDLAFDYERIGDWFKRQGVPERAEEHFAGQRAQAERLVKLAPDRAASQWALLCSIRQLASMAELRGDEHHCARLRVEALGIARSLIDLDPDNPDYVKAVFNAVKSVAADQIEVADGGAIGTLLEVEPLVRQFVAAEPANHDRLREFAGFLLGVSDAYLRKGDIADSERYASEAMEALTSLPVEATLDLHQLWLTLGAGRVLARIAFTRGESQATARFAEQAIASANRLEAAIASEPWALEILADFWVQCEAPQFCDPQRAEQLARQSIAINAGASPRSQVVLAVALRNQGRSEEAAEVAADALDMLPQGNFGLRKQLEVLQESLSKGLEP